MELISFTDIGRFKREIFPFLMRNEAQYCVPLGIVNTLETRPKTYSGAYLWGLLADGHVIGAAILTPPHSINVTKMPFSGIRTLVDTLTELNIFPSGVSGPTLEANRFRDLWTAKHSLSVRSSMSQQIYQASRVIMPASIPGFMRSAIEPDLPVLAEWSLQFANDCGLIFDRENIEQSVSIALATPSRYFWIVDGSPVSMAGVQGLTPSGIRVSWVYTPRNFRGHGYASMLVAMLTQTMLSEGRSFCFLYTDLSNPVSNSIYKRIGYQPVSDSIHHYFSNPLGGEKPTKITP